MMPFTRYTGVGWPSIVNSRPGIVDVGQDHEAGGFERDIENRLLRVRVGHIDRFRRTRDLSGKVTAHFGDVVAGYPGHISRIVRAASRVVPDSVVGVEDLLHGFAPHGPTPLPAAAISDGCGGLPERGVVLQVSQDSEVAGVDPLVGFLFPFGPANRAGGG